VFRLINVDLGKRETAVFDVMKFMTAAELTSIRYTTTIKGTYLNESCG
jgi:hypothetical protein